MVKVGAATEAEMKEKKARVEDALHATRAAVEEGIVPGGGVALLRSLKALDGIEEGVSEDQRAGIRLVRKAAEFPLRWIAQNAGIDGSIVVDKVRNGKGGFGYNAATDTYEDLVKAGVIDPTKVVRTALQNASSVASLLLTTEAMVAQKPEKKSGGHSPRRRHAGRHGRHGRHGATWVGDDSLRRRALAGTKTKARGAVAKAAAPLALSGHALAPRRRLVRRRCDAARPSARSTCRARADARRRAAPRPARSAALSAAPSRASG